MKKNSFLASEYVPAPARLAAYHVIPVPMETSVSYGGGTAAGPNAILAASQQLEATDGRFAPGRAGIYTQPAVSCSGAPAQVIARVEGRVARALAAGAAPLILGGEHTVTLGAARAFQAAGMKVGFVQFDAHADLRDAYEGSALSHASVMRRVSELGFPIIQFGVRALCADEADYRRQTGVIAYDAERLARRPLPSRLIPAGFPKLVYITFDVDGLDPAVMPATGTPVPGGLFWQDAMLLLERIAAGRRVIGADVVELAPIRGLHHADFTAALLAHRLMGLMGQGTPNIQRNSTEDLRRLRASGTLKP
jgi:agmatinase